MDAARVAALEELPVGIGASRLLLRFPARFLYLWDHNHVPCWLLGSDGTAMLGEFDEQGRALATEIQVRR